MEVREECADRVIRPRLELGRAVPSGRCAVEVWGGRRGRRLQTQAIHLGKESVIIDFLDYL